MAELDEIFATEKDFTTARDGLLQVNSILVMIKDIIAKNDTGKSTASTFELSKSLNDGLRHFTEEFNNSENITKILDTVYVVLRDGVRLTNKILNRHEDQIKMY